MKKYKIGYIAGVFDMFHIGHLNIIKRAKEKCDWLIVGIYTDEFVNLYKKTKTIVPQNNRKAIVKAIKFVDEVFLQSDLCKKKVWDKYKFDVVFAGSDWKGTDRFNEYKKDFKKINVGIEFFSYTQEISSTKLKEILK